MKRSIRALGCIAFLTGLFHTPLSANGVGSQATAVVVGPTGKIPRDSYKTWSLFLVCNPEWASPDRSRDVENLYWRYLAFGDAIGPDNLAVWFWKEKTDTKDPRLAEKIDLARSAEYCGALKEKPSDSPQLVVFYEYPDLAALPQEKGVFRFGGATPDDLATSFKDATDQLLLTGKVEVRRKTPQAPELNSAFRLLDVARTAFTNLGCAFKLILNVGALTAEFGGCSK
jgi:hypothetical protein